MASTSIAGTPSSVFPPRQSRTSCWDKLAVWATSMSAFSGMIATPRSKRTRPFPDFRHDQTPPAALVADSPQPRRLRRLAGADARRLGLAARRGVLPGAADE